MRSDGKLGNEWCSTRWLLGTAPCDFYHKLNLRTDCRTYFGRHEYDERITFYTAGKTQIQNYAKDKNIADIKYWDWSFKNLALGYAFGYTSFEAPLGFIAELNYEKQTWNAKLPLNSDYVDFTRHSFAPEACLRLHLGGDIKEFISVLIESGIRYNLAFGANGDYKNKDCLNSGITGIFGIGYIYLSLFSFSIRYEHDFFDFFNQDFAAPDGTCPYKDFTTKHGALCWNIVYMF